MKKSSIIFLIIFILIVVSALFFEFRTMNININKNSELIKNIKIDVINKTNYKSLYEKSDTISIDEYLYSDKTEEDWNTLTLNDNKDVTFKNKVILNEQGLPINRNTAYTTLEIKIYMVAAGIEQKEGCDPADTINNGTLGCYIDNPDE